MVVDHALGIARGARRVEERERIPFVPRVLEREPDWSLLPADMPSPVQTLLRRCLRKDPHKRLHDVSDALIELEEATAGGPAQSVVTLSWQRQLALAAVVIASVLLGATGAMLWNRPEPAP